MLNIIENLIQRIRQKECQYRYIDCNYLNYNVVRSNCKKNYTIMNNEFYALNLILPCFIMVIMPPKNKDIL